MTADATEPAPGTGSDAPSDTPSDSPGTTDTGAGGGTDLESRAGADAVVGTGRAPAIGHAGDPSRPALGWTEILTAAVVYLALQFLLTVVALAVGHGHLPGSPWLIALSGASAFGAVGVAGALRVRSWAALGLRRVGVRTVLTGVALGLGVWIVSRALIIAYVAITGDHSDPQADLAQFGGPVSTVFVVVLGGLVVPLGEEMLFRGIGFGGLRRYGVIVAAAASGLLFALAHGLNAVLAVALLLGVVNALTYERTRSLWPCVATHATFNLLSFALALLLR